jgi:hypothetical protein
VTVVERWEARSAIEATMEPPITESRNQGSKILDGREKNALGGDFDRPFLKAAEGECEKS